MSIRLDPRRLGTLKQLAAEASVRPGDLVRQWVEERVDAERTGAATRSGAPDLASRVAELAARVAALEAASGGAPASSTEVAIPVEAPEPETNVPAKTRGGRRTKVSAAPAGPRVALHDEMIAVLAERGPMTAADLAAAVGERGRYAPPRSGKPIDAAMVSQRVSNPTYRSRFTRNEGMIGLAEPVG